MRLNDLDKPNASVKALKENFELALNVSALDTSKTTQMLNKVRGLINESIRSPSFHHAQYTNAAFAGKARSGRRPTAQLPATIVGSQYLYETFTNSSEAMVCPAMTNLMLHRLTPT